MLEGLNLMNKTEQTGSDTTPEEQETKKSKKSERLTSIDALRGFDMFWIAGGESVIHTLTNLVGGPILLWCSYELTHSVWNGFTFYDMIFPLFLFLAGTTVPFSFTKRRARGATQGDLYKHVISRVVILVVLGLIYNGFLNFDWESTRYASVLARIGLGWGFAAMIYLNTNSWKTRMAWFWGILIGYWLILLLVPVPGVGAYVLTKGGWLGGYIDRHLLPGKLYLGVHDPEGILSTLPAIGTGLLGMMIGQLLKYSGDGWTRMKKFVYLIGIGLLGLILGQLWDTVFPINKNMWSSAFVLFVGGWSVLLLAVFYYVIDILKWRKWAFFFVVIGSNSIVAYMVLSGGFIDLHSTAEYIFGGFAGWFPIPAQAFIMSVAYIFVGWYFLYFLYKHKLFFKV